MERIRIEIRGYLIWHAHQLDEVLELKKRIDTILQILEMDRKAVTDVACALLQSCGGREEPQRCMVIHALDPHEGMLLLERFQGDFPDIDIELATIQNFIAGEID